MGGNQENEWNINDAGTRYMYTETLSPKSVLGRRWKSAEKQNLVVFLLGLQAHLQPSHRDKALLLRQISRTSSSTITSRLHGYTMLHHIHMTCCSIWKSSLTHRLLLHGCEIDLVLHLDGRVSFPDGHWEV